MVTSDYAYLMDVSGVVREVECHGCFSGLRELRNNTTLVRVRAGYAWGLGQQPDIIQMAE